MFEKNSCFNTSQSLNFLLGDILKQIKLINSFPGEEKDFAHYTKLLELFFKGADLAEKLNAPKLEVYQPQNNFIEGIGEDGF